MKVWRGSQSTDWIVAVGQHPVCGPTKCSRSPLKEVFPVGVCIFRKRVHLDYGMFLLKLLKYLSTIIIVCNCIPALLDSVAEIGITTFNQDPTAWGLLQASEAPVRSGGSTICTFLFDVVLLRFGSCRSFLWSCCFRTFRIINVEILKLR